MEHLQIKPLTSAAFAPFGDVIEITEKAQSYAINGGTTERFHDLATATATGKDARTIISMARAQAFDLPLKLTMLERHPDGSQAFIPVTPSRFVVIVAPDMDGRPGSPQAFLAGPGQGINYFQNVWHGVLTALGHTTDFIIVDRAGEGDNLQIYNLAEAIEVHL